MVINIRSIEAVKKLLDEAGIKWEEKLPLEQGDMEPICAYTDDSKIWFHFRSDGTLEEIFISKW